MSVLTDLADRMEAEGVGTKWNGSTGDISMGMRFDAINSPALFLQTYAGDPSRIRNEEYLAADERLNVQVLARGPKGNQGAAETLAVNAWTAVQGRHVTINNSTYAHIRAPQYPAYLGVDEQDRPLVVFNLELRRHGL